MDRHSARRWLSRQEDDRVERLKAARVNDRSFLGGLKMDRLPQSEHAGPDSAVEVASLRRQLIQAQIDTILTLVAAVEAKDPYTERHSLHVPQYAESIARTMHLSDRETDVIKTAALLHDSGKIGVPDAILTKPGPLTVEEFTLVKQHPVTGAAILRSATCLRRELPLVLHHHERYDGTGYPEGLRGDQIPLGARILHTADAIDAMICPRSYKRGLGLGSVMSELRLGRGTQFDPLVADAALKWLDESPEDLHTDPRGVRLCHVF